MNDEANEKFDHARRLGAEIVDYLKTEVENGRVAIEHAIPGIERIVEDYATPAKSSEDSSEEEQEAPPA